MHPIPHTSTLPPYPHTYTPPLHPLTQALEEPSFSIAYVNLCKVLSPMKVEWMPPDGKQKANNFRHVLLTKCQQEFEKDKNDDEERERMLQKIDDADMVCVCVCTNKVHPLKASSLPPSLCPPTYLSFSLPSVPPSLPRSLPSSFHPSLPQSLPPFIPPSLPPTLPHAYREKRRSNFRTN